VILTTVLAVATVALGAGGATLAARYARGVDDTVRSLAARGTGIHLISRRTRLPQDVVTMMIAGMAAAGAVPRQKAPMAAVYASLRGRTTAPREQARARNALPRNGMHERAHGMDVA
jgi:hypothetical protein